MNKKFLIPKLNLYTKKLSMFQEKLWNAFIPRSFGEQWVTDEFRFCHNAYGMRSNKHFLMDHTAGKATIQKAVSSFPYGTVSAAAQTAAALDTTITSMGNAIYDADSMDTWRVYGYTSGVDYYSYANFGSIGSATYTDGGSNSRTISAIYYHEPGSLNARADDLVFCLNATSISDTDTTFVSIEYNGVTYTRSSRSSYSPTFGSCSTWIWANINPDGPTTGNPAVVINI